MIKESYKHKRMTPKVKAQEIIARQLHAVYCEDSWKELGMTRREKDLIMDQILKIIPEIAETTGFTERLKIINRS